MLMIWMRLTMCLLLSFAWILPGVFGCASKSLQSGGNIQVAQQEPKGGASQDAPDTSILGHDPSGGLRGLDKNPKEERVAGNTIAKADSSSSSRQVDETRGEQAAGAAGLQDVFFAFDSFVISEEGRQVLTRDAEWIKSNRNALVKIEGHCDERGTSAYNMVLGEKRAKAVRNYLVELGVASNQLSVVSYGKERPFCKEHDESCYSQNRRGHLVVYQGK